MGGLALGLPFPLQGSALRREGWPNQPILWRISARPTQGSYAFETGMETAIFLSLVVGLALSLAYAVGIIR